MKRAILVIGLAISGWGALTVLRQISAIAQNIEYIAENAPNLKSDSHVPATKKFRKSKYVRKVKDPETIFEEAGYLVKIRLFKKIEVPITGQIIYQDTKSFGSGFVTDDKTICGKPKYCVVTAFHVVDDSSMTYFAEAKDGGKAQMLELMRGSTTYDFGVLRFMDVSYVPAKVAVLGRSSALKPGARIYTMGSNRYGDFWFSPSGNLYTSVKRAGPELRERLEGSGLNHPELMLFHTPVFRGFSGGPIVNKYGEVVGITVGFTGLDAEPIYIGSPIDGIRKTLIKMK